MGVSITMILVAVAPPFWGLFWAVVQPTQTGRTLRQLQESHAERLMRMQQEAELKKLRAETNAKIREAQLRGMAATAVAARNQASGLIGGAHRKGDQGEPGAATEASADAVDEGELPTEPSGGAQGKWTMADQTHAENVAEIAAPEASVAPAASAAPSGRWRRRRETAAPSDAASAAGDATDEGTGNGRLRRPSNPHTAGTPSYVHFPEEDI
jgi:hypothetical protein